MVKEKTESRSNPKGSNQHKPDPRQELFLSNYLDPKSETFSNALQSALKAGYSQEYAESLTSKMPTWLSENIGDDYLVKKAEENLKDLLEMDTILLKTTSEGMVFEVDDPAMKRIKADMTKFTLERLHKKKYSQRVEEDQTGEVTINIKHFNGEDEEDGDNTSPQL